MVYATAKTLSHSFGCSSCHHVEILSCFLLLFAQIINSVLFRSVVPTPVMSQTQMNFGAGGW